MNPARRIDRRRVSGNFSAHADDYDRYAAVQQRVVDQLRARLVPRMPFSGPLLDVGTGTGALMTAVRQVDHAQELVVMDLAHEMTRKALARQPGVMACNGDARFLPFADAAFSCVASSSVYQWVEDLCGAFKEVARVLAPGGVFALALFGEETLFELRESHRRAIANSGPNLMSHVHDFPTRQQVAVALQAAGLVCGEMDVYLEVEFHAEVPELLRQLKRIGAGNASVERPRGLASRQVMQAMMRYYEETFRCIDGLPASYEVIMALAEKPR